MGDRMLRIEEVALTINSSVQTLNNWYRWKKLNPDNELASILPDYIQQGPKQTRYWKSSDIGKLLEFKLTIPHGRNGVLGEITQRHTRKSKEETT